MSEAWVTITENDVLDSMSKRERDDFAKVSADPSRPDRLPGIIAGMISEVRGYIATWSTNTLSADPANIPPGFLARALVVIRWRVLTSVGSYEPSEARKLEYERAETFFGKVAKGEIRPQPAPDAVPNPVPSEAPSGVQWTAPGSRTGRSRMDGL